MTWRETLHKLAHWRDPATLQCSCALGAYQRGWKQRRDAELREAELRRRGEPTTADAMDEGFRRLIADSETWRGAA